MTTLTTNVFVRDFLMYCLPHYATELPSMRRIMDCMAFFLANGTSENALIASAAIVDYNEYSVNEVERRKAYDVIVFAKDNLLLIDLIDYFLMARGRPDADIMISCNWLSDFLTFDAFDTEDIVAYNRELVRWNSDPGPQFGTVVASGAALPNGGAVPNGGAHSDGEHDVSGVETGNYTSGDSLNGDSAAESLL